LRRGAPFLAALARAASRFVLSGAGAEAGDLYLRPAAIAIHAEPTIGESL